MKKENGRKELEIKDKELLFDAKAQKTWDDMAFIQMKLTSKCVFLLKGEK